MSRLVLLAVDGLDYIYAKLYGLRLAGHVYRLESRTDVNTPYLWALIQSGKPPKKNVFVEAPLWARIFCKIFRLNVRGYYRWAGKKYLAAKSIFDEYPSCVYNFPMYDWRMPHAFRKFGIREAVGDPAKSRELFADTVHFDTFFINIMFRCLQSEGSKKFMIHALWLYQVDVANHLYPRDKKLRLLIYKIIDRHAQKILRALARNDTLVVLSDHGGRNGVHTRDAVISVNKHVPPPRKVEEVYAWLKNMLEA